MPAAAEPEPVLHNGAFFGGAVVFRPSVSNTTIPPAIIAATMSPFEHMFLHRNGTRCRQGLIYSESDKQPMRPRDCQARCIDNEQCKVCMILVSTFDETND